jgi:hypothetical protein
MTTGNDAPSDRRKPPGRPAHDVFESRLAAARARQRPAAAVPSASGPAADAAAPAGADLEVARALDADLPRPRQARHRRPAAPQRAGRHRSPPSAGVWRRPPALLAVACAAVGLAAVALLLALT